jgi:hypothetical protein
MKLQLGGIMTSKNFQAEDARRYLSAFVIHLLSTTIFGS